MESIRAFELKNNGAFVARLRVKSSSGESITSGDILINSSKTIDLNQYLNKINDGDTVWLEAVVVGGKNKTSSKKFIYRAGALEKANYEISSTTMSSKLKFVDTKKAYDYHFFFDKEPHEINGIYYVLVPEDSIAIVHEHLEEYKGAVKIPRTITYQKKKYVVTEIGNQAFGYCDELTSLTLPASICFIGDFVFIEDSNLKTIRVETDTPPFVEVYGFQEFDNIDNCTLYVPLGSTEIYRKEYCWNQFKNIKAFWNKLIIDRINKEIIKIRGVKNLRIKPERPQK